MQAGSQRRMPPEVGALLAGPLDTFEKLELVSYLSRHDGGARRSRAEQDIPLAPALMQEVIADLIGARVIEADGEADPELRLGPRARGDDFTALVKLYAEDRPAVMSTLTTLALDRIRGMAARTFANAFVVRSSKRR